MKNFNSLLSFVLLLATSFSAFSQQLENIPLIEVEGISSKSQAPDQASFNIFLQEKAMNVTTATSILNTKTGNLADALKKAKIKDYKLIADNFSVDVNRIKRGNNMLDSGFVARQSLRIITSSQNQDLQKISEAIESAGDMSYRLEFDLSEQLQKSLENTLIIEALLDAQRRAMLVAETLGIRNIRVHHVNFDQSYRPTARMMLGNEAKSPMLLAPDDQKLTQRVYVKYTY